MYDRDRGGRRAGGAPASTPEPAPGRRALTDNLRPASGGRYVPTLTHPAPAAEAESTPGAPTSAVPFRPGDLAIVQRSGPLRPRYPGDHMSLRGPTPAHDQVVEPIMPGTFVRVIRSEGEWTHVKHREIEGWVRTATLHQADLSQNDLHEEARYRLGAFESSNRAGHYSPQDARVNIGLGSWTGSRIGRLLRHYRETALAKPGGWEALNAHFNGQFDALVERFRAPSMDEHPVTEDEDGRETWNGPELSPAQRKQFESVEGVLPWLRAVEERELDADIAHYLGLLAHTAYPFVDPDGTISEVALHVIISAFHQGGDGRLPGLCHTANAHFGVHTRETDNPRESPALVRGRTDELGYLRFLSGLMGNLSHTRYTQILSMYADSPRRHPVPIAASRPQM